MLNYKRLKMTLQEQLVKWWWCWEPMPSLKYCGLLNQATVYLFYLLETCQISDMREASYFFKYFSQIWDTTDTFELQLFIYSISWKPVRLVTCVRHLTF